MDGQLGFPQNINSAYMQPRPSFVDAADADGMPQPAQMEYEDEDEYSYDDMDEDSEDESQGREVDSLGALPVPVDPTELRTPSHFATDNVLASYYPSSKNSPLNDTRTASIFWYFVNVTGPTMSLYERHPVNPSPIFEGKPVPKSAMHLWTCT